MIFHSLTQLFPPHAISKVNRFEPLPTPNQYGNCLTQITIFSANPNHCSQYSLPHTDITLCRHHNVLLAGPTVPWKQNASHAQISNQAFLTKQRKMLAS